MNAASRAFHVPELLEYILLSLPCNNTTQEFNSIRTIILGQTTCRTWYALVQKSTPIRQMLYLPTPADKANNLCWQQKHPYPPARPNVWIPFLLLEQRSWGSAYPFDNVDILYHLQPTSPRFWTFSFEISKRQYDHLPKPGPWRNLLAASPPFTHFWSTRSFYELGSGRAPFVAHVDYDPQKQKHEQKYAKSRPGGVTLGDLVDAVCELFQKFEQTKFVMVESVRAPGGGPGFASAE
ncbi:hypothetical protein AC578_8578 [Pseudocercospora eumusae]|uniref:Uncharacterized protein n=1 Tax=Pseudocercospora eumusae TaxID=321146 RepID=A0A139HW17_9PEZI|nr:hypothetical protein AC578_8578 [Pseudocercospora eumusae]